MNLSIIRYILGWVLQFEALFMLCPALTGVIYGESKPALCYFGMAAVCAVLGFLFRRRYPKNDALYDELLPILFPNAQVLTYKQWFGECYSASALGFYVAAQWIARGQQKHVLVVTLDRMGDAAMTYLRKI